MEWCKGNLSSLGTLMQQSTTGKIQLSITSSLSEACESLLSKPEVVGINERHLLELLAGKFSSNALITSTNLLLMDHVQTLGTWSWPDIDADQISVGIHCWWDTIFHELRWMKYPLFLLTVKWVTSTSSSCCSTINYSNAIIKGECPEPPYTAISHSVTVPPASFPPLLMLVLIAVETTWPLFHLYLMY